MVWYGMEWKLNEIERNPERGHRWFKPYLNNESRKPGKFYAQVYVYKSSGSLTRFQNNKSSTFEILPRKNVHFVMILTKFLRITENYQC